MKSQLAVLSRIAIIAALVLSGCSRTTSAASPAGTGGAPAAPGVDSGATRRVDADDPALQMTAFTLAVPKSWRFTGMISRPGGCHGPAVAADGLTYTALAPDGISASEKLPGATWAWLSDGSSFGKCKPVNIDTALGFLLNIALPNLRPDAKDVTVLPLPEKLKQAVATRNAELQSHGPPQVHRTVDAALIHLTYSYQGHPVEEQISAAVMCSEMGMPAYPLLHRPAIQRRICTTAGTFIMRAPQGKLEALKAGLQKLPPAQINPRWDALIVQQMKSQLAAWQRANDEQFKAIQDHFKDVTAGFLERGRQFQAQQKSSFDNAMAQDRATQAAIDHSAQMQVRDSLNRQDFIDPRTGQRIETSNQYTHNWISSDGQSVVLNGDATFDPNGLVDPVRQSWTELIPVN